MIAARSLILIAAVLVGAVGCTTTTTTTAPKTGGIKAHRGARSQIPEGLYLSP
jgi:uncharacterized protein YceK